MSAKILSLVKAMNEKAVKDDFSRGEYIGHVSLGHDLVWVCLLKQRNFSSYGVIDVAMNEAGFQALGLKEGDTIKFIRSGDIIDIPMIYGLQNGAYELIHKVS